MALPVMYILHAFLLFSTFAKLQAKRCPTVRTYHKALGMASPYVFTHSKENDLSQIVIEQWARHSSAPDSAPKTMRYTLHATKRKNRHKAALVTQ